jgi:uncharacterized protein (DUF305 family)
VQRLQTTLIGLLGAAVMVVIPGCSMGSASQTEAEFVAAMVPHHRLGVELLQIAEPRVNDVRVRRLVFEMASYHDADLHHLDHYLSGWSLAEAEVYSGWLDPQRVRALESLSGAEFDVAWLEAMIEHHEGALDLSVQLVDDGGRKDLVTLATGILKVQSRELAQMRQLLKEKSEG